MTTRQQLEDQVGRGDAQHGGVQEAPHVDTWCRRNIMLGRVSATQREKTLLRAVLVRRETRVSDCDCGHGFSEPRRVRRLPILASPPCMWWSSDTVVLRPAVRKGARTAQWAPTTYLVGF